MKLVLGVIDIPYSQGSRRGGTVTTGDVAGFLENKYHIMQIFFEEKADAVILPEIEKSVTGAITSLFAGAPATIDPFGSGTSKIEDAFKQFIATKEVEKLGIPGVPTQAALRGVSHRFKRPYQRRPPRPSFLDTVLFLASFKAWVTG
jgi:hypothetical protein